MGHSLIGSTGGSTASVLSEEIGGLASNLHERHCRFQIDLEKFHADKIHLVARSHQFLHGGPGGGIPPHWVFRYHRDCEMSSFARRVSGRNDIHDGKD